MSLQVAHGQQEGCQPLQRWWNEEVVVEIIVLCNSRGGMRVVGLVMQVKNSKVKDFFCLKVK